jgi:galactokinase
MPNASAAAARALFERRFGRPPVVVASAPGRVNLIGEHIDYNGGDVLPIAIAFRTAVAVGPAPPGATHVVSTTTETEGAFNQAAPERSGQWWDYVAGSARAVGTHLRPPPPLQIAVAGNVPEGAGLSSSAALEVASAAAIAACSGPPVEPLRLAAWAFEAETQYVGVQCGIMDQYASALSQGERAIHLHCATREFTLVPMRQTVLVFDTAEPRGLRTSAYNTRRAECDEALRLVKLRRPDVESLADATLDDVSAALDGVLARRARHVVTEMARVGLCVDALARGESLPGDLLLGSHASLRDDFECSSPALDWFVERVMREPGVTGARLTGAGWGGCAIAVGDESALRDASATVTAEYARAFGRAPRSWLTRAEAGACVDTARDNGSNSPPV